MLVPIAEVLGTERRSILDFVDTPIGLGLPPYPKATVVRIRCDVPEMNVQRGDFLVVDRDGSIVTIIHTAHAAIRPGELQYEPELSQAVAR